MAGLFIAVMLLAAPLGPDSAPSRPSENCASALSRLAAAGNLAELRWPDFSDYKARVLDFYEPTNYALAWIQEGVATGQADAIVEVLRQANQKGLDQEDYDGPRWPDRLAALRHAEPSDVHLAQFDLALTISVMRYLSDLRFGRVNPGVFDDHDLEREKRNLSGLTRRLVDAGDIPSALAGVEPPFEGYQRTLEILQRYLAIAHADDGELLPATKKPIEPESSYAGVARLASLLQRLGDLPPDIPAPAIYGGALVDAVRHFQMRHGLDPDGRIGKATLEQLNAPLSRRVRQLELALERWRWVPHSFVRPPVVVNIPEFRLRAWNGSHTTELEMKVVVGKAYRHETPVFSADMNSVIFRPYWNVPRSIQRDELVPKIDKDRAYLAKNGYEIMTLENAVVTNGVVDDSTLAQLRAGKLGIRQIPGPKNSLGLVKFLFPNEHDVYLHATPATELFSKSRRDFSHGCIRVEKPEVLANWVLKQKPEWTPDRIAEAMTGEKTLAVSLDKPIPLLIVYATAVALSNGEVHFLEDIYGEDAALENLLARRYLTPGGPTSGVRDPRLHE